MIKHNLIIINFSKLCLISIFPFIIYKTIYTEIRTNFYKNEANNFLKTNFGESDNNYTKILANKVNDIFKNKGFVNINEVEDDIYNLGKKFRTNKKNEINIGAQLDPNFTLQAMITFASILDSQNKNTKIRFHIAVVLNFDIFDMLKIYSLRKKIRDDVEFNFYNASRVEKDLDSLNLKGPGAVAKLLLPQLLADDIDRLLVFDTGDLIVLKDLKEQYNWDMKDNLYVGVPGGRIGQKSIITNQTYKNYINIGSFLINVPKVKSENMYEKFVKYKNYYHSNIGDQDLLNDISIGRVGMYPIKFGAYSPFIDDSQPIIPTFKKINKDLNGYLPQNVIEYLKGGYIPYVIHQWNGKWNKGSGLTIYRRIAQYYIRYAGIWEETCKKFPGYCIK